MYLSFSTSSNTYNDVNYYNNKCWTDLLSVSASDLVMKVDALLAAAPKGEVRRDVHFKDTHRYRQCFFFKYSNALSKHIYFPFGCALLSSVCSTSHHEKMRCSTMLWPLLTPSPEKHRRFPLY